MSKIFTDLVSTKSPSVSFTVDTNDISVLIGCDKILSSSQTSNVSCQTFKIL